MNDTLSPLERALTAYVEKALRAQRRQIRRLEEQVAMLMAEREQMRSMLEFVEQLNAAEESSQS